MGEKGRKFCEGCGLVFWKGTRYNTTVLVLLIIFLFPIGIIYWLVKRSERCPRCDSKRWHIASEAEVKKAEEKGEVIR